MKERNENEPVYIISVAAKLAGVHPQTLRLYEKEGIICPKRSAGNIRLYSQKDIDRTIEARRIIKKYGVNISAVKLIIELEEEVENLRKKISQLEE
ncbi:MAG: MerR family transcriptional regulator [Actinobacteria bacterium]|nr:MerR family transcriptional regulator [Actinomycetota bacterium]